MPIPMLTIAHALLGDLVFLLRLLSAFEDLRGTFHNLCSRLLTLALSGQQKDYVLDFIAREKVWNCTNVLNQGNTCREGPSNNPIADVPFRTSDLKWKVLADALFRTSFLNNPRTQWTQHPGLSRTAERRVGAPPAACQGTCWCSTSAGYYVMQTLTM